MSDESKKTVFRKIVVPEESKSKKMFLVGNTPPFVGKTIELKSKFTVGRTDGHDLHIPFGTVSSNHAEFNQEGEDFQLVDLGSSNGTFLNNTQLEPEKTYALNHKDIIKFDTYEYFFIDSSRSDLWETLKPLSREGTSIIAMFSPKGGTGLTSISVNLARTFAEHSQKKVAISDFNFYFGDVLTFSCGKPGPSIYNLIQEPNITGELIERYLIKGPGYDYLAAPGKAEDAERVKDWGKKNPELIQKVLWSLEAAHDFVIVDLENVLDDISLTTLEVANFILLTGFPEIGHMLALRKVLDVFDQLKYPETKVKVLINRMGRENTLTSEEIKSFLKRDFFTLPDAPADAILSSHCGKLYVQDNPSCPLSQGIQNLVRSMRGEEIQEVASEGGVFGKLRSLLGF